MSAHRTRIPRNNLSTIGTPLHAVQIPIIPPPTLLDRALRITREIFQLLSEFLSIAAFFILYPFLVALDLVDRRLMPEAFNLEIFFTIRTKTS